MSNRLIETLKIPAPLQDAALRLPRLAIKIRRLYHDAKLPEYAHGPEEDAGMDLFALEGAELPYMDPVVVRTGVSIELPPGFEGQIRSKSGLAAKYGIKVVNSPGTIDPGFRGEIKVILQRSHVLDEGTYTIKPGDKIAQLVIARYEAVSLFESEELSESLRGEGGLGSTGR